MYKGYNMYIDYDKYLKLKDKDNYQPVMTSKKFAELKEAEKLQKISITISKLSADELNEMEQDGELELNI